MNSITFLISNTKNTIFKDTLAKRNNLNYSTCRHIETLTEPLLYTDWHSDEICSHSKRQVQEDMIIVLLRHSNNY